MQSPDLLPLCAHVFVHSTPVHIVYSFPHVFIKQNIKICEILLILRS